MDSLTHFHFRCVYFYRYSTVTACNIGLFHNFCVDTPVKKEDDLVSAYHIVYVCASTHAWHIMPKAKSQLKSTSCLTAKFGSFLDHAELKRAKKDKM